MGKQVMVCIGKQKTQAYITQIYQPSKSTRHDKNICVCGYLWIKSATDSHYL